jgi:hypothetical protein
MREGGRSHAPEALPAACCVVMASLSTYAPTRASLMLRTDNHPLTGDSIDVICPVSAAKGPGSRAVKATSTAAVPSPT